MHGQKDRIGRDGEMDQCCVICIGLGIPFRISRFTDRWSTNSANSCTQ